jgi:hypothetical protein
MLQQVLHVASVFISRHEKRVKEEAVPVCRPSNMACKRSSTACVGAQQQTHAGACSRSMWAHVAGASRSMWPCAAGRGRQQQHA